PSLRESMGGPAVYHETFHTHAAARSALLTPGVTALAAQLFFAFSFSFPAPSLSKIGRPEAVATRRRKHFFPGPNHNRISWRQNSFRAPPSGRAQQLSLPF